MIEPYLWLIPLGFLIGVYGTLIGAGGGFVLVPILLVLYPNENPEVVTSISLAVVFFNALSGSAVYARMNRIDYKSGIIFSAATIPGAILGAISTAFIPRRAFDLIFGVLITGVSVFLLLHPKGPKKEKMGNDLVQNSTQANYNLQLFFNSRFLGVGLGIVLGYISSLLGIGAGFLYVPMFVYFLGFPVHVATATSQFILAIMAFAGSATHVVSGTFHHGVRRTVALAIGVVLGAQLGARLSDRVHGDWILRSLAVALGFVGVRLIILAL